MNRTTPLLAIAAAVVLGTAGAAQTAGVCGVNDLTLLPFLGTPYGSGTTSGTQPPFVMNGTPHLYQVTARETALFTCFVFSACPVSPCGFGGGLTPPAGCGLPFGACGGATNHSLDIDPFAPCSNASVVFCIANNPTDVPCPDGGFAGSHAAVIFPAPPPGHTLSIQALVVDPGCAPAATGFLFTQAFDLLT